MSLIGLYKLRKDNLQEIPPVVDDKGEITEVQVLEEGDGFDLSNSWINCRDTNPQPSESDPCVMSP